MRKMHLSKIFPKKSTLKLALFTTLIFASLLLQSNLTLAAETTATTPKTGTTATAAPTATAEKPASERSFSENMADTGVKGGGGGPAGANITGGTANNGPSTGNVCPSGMLDLFKIFTIDCISETFFRVIFWSTNFVLGSLVSLSGWLFNKTIDWMMTADMTIVTTGWTITLKFANNFFIFILLGIAISIILGIDILGWNKKMLPKFIMAALLINFSLVIGGLVIDATNFLAKDLNNQIVENVNVLGKGNDNSASAKIAASMNLTQPTKNLNVEFLETKTKDAKNGENTFIASFTKHFLDFIFLIFVDVTTIIVFLSGVVYMIQRTFWLWFLLMIAPLAWIAMLIPKYEQYWSDWWKKFISWSLFAPAYLFFLWLGLLVGTESQKAVAKVTAIEGFSLDKSYGYIMQNLVVVFVILIGSHISKALGVGGSNFVLNYANKAKGAASKRFIDLYGQTPLSAEKLGKKFGTFGASVATLGGRVMGKPYREFQEKERLTKQKEKRDLNDLKIKEAKQKRSKDPLHEIYTRAMAKISAGDIDPDTAADLLILKEEAKILDNALRAAGKAAPTTQEKAKLSVNSRIGIDAALAGENKASYR